MTDQEQDAARVPATPRDAATVVLLRDLPTGGFEVFMIRRHRKSGFMAGAHVFPGGKLDPSDTDAALHAHTTGRTSAQAASALAEPDDPTRAIGLFVAAIRETFEEAGILIANVPPDARLADARARLEAGVSFADVVVSLRATLRLDALVPRARWITPEAEPRRFDARFFFARTPAAQEPVRDRRETTDAAWMTPASALARERAGEISLPPPTLRTLELLSGFTSAEAALADAAAQPPPLVRPIFRDEEGTLVLTLPGDPTHPEPHPVLPGSTRFVLARGRWWSSAPPPLDG